MSYPFAVVDGVANGSFNGLFQSSKDLLLGLLNVFLSHDLQSCCDGWVSKSATRFCRQLSTVSYLQLIVIAYLP